MEQCEVDFEVATSGLELALLSTPTVLAGTAEWAVRFLFFGHGFGIVGRRGGVRNEVLRQHNVFEGDGMWSRTAVSRSHKLRLTFEARKTMTPVPAAQNLPDTR